jgi:hypothetical protein
MIGEIMTDPKNDDGEFFCMDYSNFRDKWDTDKNFKDCFEHIRVAIEEFQRVGKPFQDLRLRHLQHLLVDLMGLLDPKKVRTGTKELKKLPLEPTKGCKCKTCSRLRCQKKTRIKLPWRVKDPREGDVSVA